ncbi:MSCRAMM family protein [Carnobacterium divergens]|nr:SpaA isopeptide-forming pilin-related protein [Carnobacterium divergens]MDO0874653.1 SpaA isopeptide-forming pilin-related protein [Carnobacterium divergens]SUX22761.1 Predicted outer membrane protein [Carnobacterium divergens]
MRKKLSQLTTIIILFLTLNTTFVPSALAVSDELKNETQEQVIETETSHPETEDPPLKQEVNESDNQVQPEDTDLNTDKTKINYPIIGYNTRSTGVMADKFPQYYVASRNGVVASQSVFGYFEVDGQVAYCVQPDVLFADGNFTPQTSFAGISESQASRVNEIVNFGSGGAGTAGFSREFFITTQVMVWEALGWNIEISMPGLAEYRNQIENAINHYQTIPSINQSTQSVVVNEKSSFADTKGVLSHYRIASDGTNSGAKINGNALEVTPKVTSTNGTITLVRDRPYSGSQYFWVNPGSQTVTTGGNNNPITIRVNLNVIKNGHVKLMKKREDGELIPGAIFRLTYNGQTKEVTTNAKGEAELKDVLDGTEVTVQEIKAAYGYVINRTPQKVIIKANKTATLTFNNKRQRGVARIHKKDSETGDHPQGAATLNGAVYGLFKSDGTKIKSITLSPKAGIVQGEIKDLYLGSYYWLEEKAPVGYNLNPNKIPFTIEYAGQEVAESIKMIEAKEDVIKGNIDGYKVGNKTLLNNDLTINPDIKPPLSNVEITATSKTTGIAYSTLTDKDGYFILKQLPYDTYKITETKGKEGYKLFVPFEVKIEKQGYTHHYVLEDKVIESKIQVFKVDSETNKTIPRSGAKFKIFDRKATQWVEMLKPNSVEKTTIFETNEEGYLVTSEMLKWGEKRYELHEIEAPEGYVLAKEPVVFSVLEMNADGIIVIKFKNDNQKGKVNLHKNIQQASEVKEKDSEFGKLTEINYTLQNGEGFEFKIRPAKDIITPDGTVRYKKGEFIQVDKTDFILKTDASGNAESPEFLYIGEYELVETKAPYGVVKLKEPIKFEIKYQGQLIDLTSASVKADNYLQKIDVLGYKQQETVTEWKDNSPVIQLEAANNGQVFALKNTHELVVGDVAIPADTTLNYAVVKDGIVKFEDILLPNVDGNYYIQEVDSKANHILDTHHYPFEYKAYNNEDKQTIHVWKDSFAVDKNALTKQVRNQLINELFKTNVSFKKINESATLKPNEGYVYAYDQVGKGATFELLDEAGKVIQTTQTDDEGMASWKELIVGTYYQREVKPSDQSHVLNTEKLKIIVTKEKISLFNEKGTLLNEMDVTENEEVFPLIELKNEHVKGIVELSKSDVSTGEVLPNTGIKILDKDNQTVVEGRTDENGKFTFENLPDGEYAFVEFDAPEGYLIDETPVLFTIKNHGEIVKCQMTNKRKPLVSSGVNNPQVTKLVLGSLMISAISGVFVFERIRKRIKK